MKICPNCSAASPDAGEYCQQCGYQFNASMNYSSTASQDANTGRMKYCRNCNQQTEFQNTVCPICGSSIFSPTPALNERPTGVLILAILGMMGGILDIIAGILLGIIFPLFTLVFAVIGLLFLFGSAALLTGKNWARIVVLVFSVLSLFDIPIGTILGIIFIYYLTRPHVYNYFHQGTQRL